MARLLLHLGAVVGHDLVAGELERLPEPRRQGGQGVGKVPLGHPEVFQLAAVEAGGEIPQGVVAWDVEVTNQDQEPVAIYTILTLVRRKVEAGDPDSNDPVAAIADNPRAPAAQVSPERAG